MTNFFPSVVATLGYSRNRTYGLTAVGLPFCQSIVSSTDASGVQPPYILCVIAMILNGFHSDRVRGWLEISTRTLMKLSETRALLAHRLSNGHLSCS